ncbi:hypothetical protein ACQQ2Q_03065 [Agrobacterium sp. ES01]|uniref:hypothetical protein n=1 Tax=Agrobacterium sp. ES01 TaxID=3420714 RepID=UPI003D100683
MHTTYCDIVPHSGGWLCLIEGQKPRGFNSFWLALAAARQSAQQSANGKRIVIRRQDPSGALQSMADDQHGFSSSPRS